MALTLGDLRRFAVARTLFAPTSLKRALQKLQFVQADPIRAPARAQDLLLRHRVAGYRAGDLERRYQSLGIEEDFFINYGFVTRALQSLMHPRSDCTVPAEGRSSWPAARRKQARLLMDFILERGEAHPREVDSHFSHGTVRNYWGGSSSATTHLLDAMHYQGMLRVVRRDAGIRIYAAQQHAIPPDGPEARRARIDALVDVVVNIYAPLPSACLRDLVRRLRFATPQWHGEFKSAFERACARLAHARINGIDWYWPSGEDPADFDPPDSVRLLTPFDPLVWDRDRLELLWGWVYRFEAYTPPAKRKMGYYALPLLWRDRVLGWGNLAVRHGRLESGFGYVAAAPPRGSAFRRELDAELDRIRVFLSIEP